MQKPVKDLSIIEAYEEQDDIDEKIKSYFSRRKLIRQKINSRLPLLELITISKKESNYE